MPTSEELYKQAQEVPAFNREQAFADWQSGKKPFLDAVMSNYERPTPTLTPEQEKKARFASALTDSFTSLAQLFGHGQGARIQARTGKTNQQSTNERLEAFRKKYEDDMARYNDRKTNAGMMDFQDYVRAAQENRGEKRQNLLLDANRAESYEKRNQERTWKLEDETRQRKEAKEDYQYKMELNDQYDRKKEARQEARRKANYGSGGNGYSGGGLPRGYTNLQDSRGNYVQMHKDAWQNAAQEVYGEMTRKGIIPRLTVPGTNAYGLPMQIEVKVPSQIAAYVAQHADEIPDDQWAKLYARSRGEAYTAQPATQPATSKTQQTNTVNKAQRTKSGTTTTTNNDPLGLYH